MTRYILALLAIVFSTGSLQAAPSTNTPSKSAKTPSVANSPTIQNWQQGRKLLEDGKAAEAVSVLKKVIATGKAPALAYYYLAKSLEKLGKESDAPDAVNAANTFLAKANPGNQQETAAALKILEPRMRLVAKGLGAPRDVIAFFTFSRNPLADRNLLEKSLILLSNYTFDDTGISSVKALIKRYPNEKLFYRYLSAMYANGAGNRDEALQFCIKATEVCPAEVSVWTQLGDLHYRELRFDQALPAYKKALELKSDDPEITKRLAATCYALDMTDDAVTYLISYYQSLPDDSTRWTHGRLLIKLCNTTRQLEQLQEMLGKQSSVQQRDFASPILLADVLRKQGQEAQAAAVEGKLIDSTNDVGQLEKLAWQVYQWGKLHLVPKLYESIEALKPGQDPSYELVTCALYQAGKGNLQEAYGILKKVLSMPKLIPQFDSFFFSSLRNSGFSYLESTERFAREEYQQDPRSSVRGRLLASILADRGKLVEAMGVQKKLVFNNSDVSRRDHEMLLNLAQRQDKLRELVPVYQAAIERNSSDPELHRALGMIYMALDEYPAAVTQYLKLRELLPQDDGITWGLGLIYRNSGQLPKAIRELSVLNEKTKSAGQRKIVGQVLKDLYHQSGKLEEGIAFFKKLTVADPDDTASAQYLAELYILSDQPDKAIKTLEDNLSNDTGFHVSTDVLADLSIKSGKPDQGIAVLRRLLAKHPAHSNATVSLTELLLHSNRINEAVKLYSSSPSHAWLISLPYRVSSGRISPGKLVTMLTACPVKNVVDAQALLECINKVFESAATTRLSRSQKAELTALVQKFAGSVQTKFPDSNVAVKAAQTVIHCGIISHLTPQPDKPDPGEGNQCILELQKVLSQYSGASAAADCAFDLLSVYRRLNKTAESNALETRIINGEFGGYATRKLLKERGIANRKAGRFKEAVNDLTQYIRILEKDPVNFPVQAVSLPQGSDAIIRERDSDRTGLREAQVELAKACYGLGDMDRFRSAAEEAIMSKGEGASSLDSDYFLLRRLLRHGETGLHLYSHVAKDRIVTINADEVISESRGELTSRYYSELSLQSLQLDPVPMSLRMAIPSSEEMIAFPDTGKPVDENGIRSTEWSLSLSPSEEDSYTGVSFGYEKTTTDELQPIKGLKVNRSCTLESPGIWRMDLSVSADENVTVAVSLPAGMEFDWETVKSDVEPKGITPNNIEIAPCLRKTPLNSMVWYKQTPDGGKQAMNLTASIKMMGSPATPNFMPEITISAVKTQFIQPEILEDNKSFRTDFEGCGLLLSSGKRLSQSVFFTHDCRIVVLKGKN